MLTHIFGLSSPGMKRPTSYFKYCRHNFKFSKNVFTYILENFALLLIFVSLFHAFVLSFNNYSSFQSFLAADLFVSTFSSLEIFLSLSHLTFNLIHHLTVFIDQDYGSSSNESMSFAFIKLIFFFSVMICMALCSISSLILLRILNSFVVFSSGSYFEMFQRYEFVLNVQRNTLCPFSWLMCTAPSQITGVYHLFNYRGSSA